MTPEREATLRALATEHARDFLEVFKALDNERQRLRELAAEVIRAQRLGGAEPGQALAQLAISARIALRESENP